MDKQLDLAQIRSRINKLRLDALLSDKRSAPAETVASALSNVPALPENPYESAAAVIAWFDPASIRPVDTDFIAEGREALVDELLLASVPTKDEEGMRRWTLAGDRRVQVLLELRKAGAVAAALRANPDAPGGMLRRGLQGIPLVDEAATLPELRAAAAVASTLSQAGFAFSPTHSWINDRIERLTLLAPFEHLAGERFRGRVAELARLRRFVGVVPPRSYLEAAERAIHQGAVQAMGHASRLFGRTPSFAIAISGPGGVGKSSLVARFILEHAQAHAEHRFPFAYVDFDRPDISTEEPVTVLAEAVRQLGIQYPDFRADCERLRLAWLGKLQDNTDRERLRQVVVDEAMHWVIRIGGSDRPFVLVLDTFEEVQYLGDFAVDALFRLLEDLRDKVPKMRIIIAGRAEVEGRPVTPIKLSTFDTEAGVAFLRAHGIGNDEAAERIYAQCGGSPLSLSLAAELVRSDPSAIGNLTQRGSLFPLLGRLNDEQIQRQLYQRVLEHIHDAEVKLLAHPGLVVRRITPTIIREVLATPCGIEIASPEAAQALFGKLQREISLVRLEPDGSLRHRADVRQLMIGPLQRDRPKQARSIHEAAANFYARGTSEIDRAELIYHRLWLSSLDGREHDLDEIATQWRLAVARHLSGAVAEFPPRQRAFLAARIGVAADPEALAAARQADWEILIARVVEGLMRNGQLKDAFEALQARPARERCSSLAILEAEMLLQLRHRDAAMTLLHAEVQRMQPVSLGRAEAGRETDFLFDVCKLVILLQDERLGREVARLLDETLNRDPSRSVRMQASAQLAFLAEFVSGVSPAHAGGLLLQMESANLERLRKEAHWLAAAPGSDVPARVGRFVEAFGLVHASEAGLRQLGAALGRADVAYSEGAQHSLSQASSTGGEFVARHNIPWVRSVTESWSAYVVGTAVADLGPVILDVLRSLPESGREDLAQALRRLLCEALGVLDERPAPGQVATPRRPRTTAPARYLHRLVDAIDAAFEPGQLYEILSRRLERSLEAYWSDGPSRRNVLLLAEAAQAQGWLERLVQALLDARPGDERLAKAAARIGVSSLANDVETTGSFAHLVPERERQAWRAKLVQIERATCLVTAGNTSMTGLLIGPDLVLTADVLKDTGAASFDVEFRFGRGDDDASSERGYVQSSTFRLARGGVAASGMSAGVRYLLFRVDGEPGAQPVGSVQAEAIAELRRWVELSPNQSVPFPGMPLMIAHYPGGRSLKLSEGWCRSVKPFAYDMNTEAGSAGGPVFDATTLEVVGLHLGKHNRVLNTGVAITDVLADLVHKRLDHLLFSRFA